MGNALVNLNGGYLHVVLHSNAHVIHPPAFKRQPQSSQRPIIRPHKDLGPEMRWSMERKSFGVLAAGVALLAAAMPARAHHSFQAVFDANQPVTVRGVITQVRLENPHSWFYLDVKDANGKVEKWSFEGSTPTSSFEAA